MTGTAGDTRNEDAGDGGWVEVYAGGDRERWLEFALVLAALGLDHWLEASGEEYRLLVLAPQYERARRELAEYAAEVALAGGPASPEPPASLRGSGMGFLPGYWVVLLSLDAFCRHRVFGLDWLAAGRAQAGLIVHGQWWRAVTALTLHADGSHLFNNLVFGSLFGVLLAQEVGVGWAWLGMLATGTLGNLLNAWVHGPGHASIGASTGVFGALGLLMGQQWRQPASAPRGRLRRWAPPVIGAVFLGLLGTAGERTDVTAHVAGAALGLAMGRAAGRPPGRWQPAPGSQALPAGVVLLLLAAAWWLALARQS